MSGRRAQLIVLEPVDTVAVTLAPLRPGDVAASPDGTTVQIVTRVPRAHKVALRDHAAGEPVVKYGASIGVATQRIARGEHVHVHNVRTVRGRRSDAASEDRT
jgi:altronate hydrolase